jgi:RNA polymerase sigma factor (sigma-70 family)
MKAAQAPTLLRRPSVTSLLGELYPTREDSGAFYREVTRQAVRHAAKKVRNRADAEDIGQQTAFSAWQYIDRFDPLRQSIKHWVRLTANAVINRHLASVYKIGAVIVDYVDIDKIDVIDPRSREMDDRNDVYERLLDCFQEDVELLDLLLAGFSQTECEHELGLTRKAIRYRIEKARTRGHFSTVNVNR